MSESRLGSSKLDRVKFHFGSRKNREEIRKNEKSKHRKSGKNLKKI